MYAVVALANIDLPGVYMDEVNPDYLTVKVLNPQHQPIIAWVLRGNYLLGNRVPLLIALYHGSQTFWFGLPLFWLFGTSVESLRLSHMLLGMGVLMALFYMLRRLAVHPVLTAAICAAMAVDPSFSYAFRTQSYITLAPSAWLLLSVGLLVGARPPLPPRLMLSGALAGLAAGGYFVQAFFLPALLIAVVLVIRAAPERSLNFSLRWPAGFLIGFAPNLIGYVRLMKSVGGPLQFLEFIREQQAELGAFSSTASLEQRLGYAWQLLAGVIDNAFHHTMIFGAWIPLPFSWLKIGILLVLPAALCIIAQVRGTASFATKLVGCLIASFLIVALVFGTRLGGHHYVVLLPWLYAWLALSLRDSATGLAVAPATVRSTLAACAIAVLGVNIVGQVREARLLRETGGVGLMSDAIDRFAMDLNVREKKPAVLFPDWGLALPIIFLTKGSVEAVDAMSVDDARQRLCAGTDFELAVLKDREARRNRWMDDLGYPAPPQVTSYRQRDGTVVFEVIHFSAQMMKEGHTLTHAAPPCR